MGVAVPAPAEHHRPMDEAVSAWRKVSSAALEACTGKLTPAARIAAMSCLVLAAACAVAEAPRDVAAPIDPTPVEASAAPSQGVAVQAEPPRSETKEEPAVASAPPPAAPGQPPVIGGATDASEPVAAAPTPASRSASAAKAAQPPAKAPAKVPTPAPPVEQPQRPDRPPPAARAQEPPALDVAALKARLRDTKAIGLFTKLALKNQVDDLLQQFRAHYLNGQKTNVAALRQPYDMLVLKVLALVQDSDPSLARSISGSREAIWSILADPDKFNSAS